jgi:hypothetical protein
VEEKRLVKILKSKIDRIEEMSYRELKAFLQSEKSKPGTIPAPTTSDTVAEAAQNHPLIASLTLPKARQSSPIEVALSDLEANFEYLLELLNEAQDPPEKVTELFSRIISWWEQLQNQGIHPKKVA